MIVSFDVIFTGDLLKAVLGGQPEAGACEAPRCAKLQDGGFQ